MSETNPDSSIETINTAVEGFIVAAKEFADAYNAAVAEMIDEETRPSSPRYRETP